jgi:hypothetical protein
MNLWGDFDNQHALNPGESARPGQKRGARRRLTEQVVVTALREWLLRGYATAYCRSLLGMSIYRRCYWIDALGFETKTHPAMLQTITAISSTLRDECPAHPLALYGLLLAAQPTGKAQPATATWTLPKGSGSVAASWANAAAEILQSIAQSPAIFSLNPFGQALYSLDLLAPIYRRATAPTELCLLIPHQQATSHVLAASRAPDKASTLTELLQSDRWKMLPMQQAVVTSSIPGNTSTIEGLLDLLTAALRKHFTFVQCIPLTMSSQPTLVETAPYSLLYATRRKESLTCMNDALCFERRRVEEESCRGVLGEAWFAEKRQARLAEEMHALYEEALHSGRSGHIRRWPDLRQHLLLAHFGQFSSTEYDSIVRRLLSEGNVRCEWKQKRAITETKVLSFETIPGADDMLMWG